MKYFTLLFTFMFLLACTKTEQNSHIETPAPMEVTYESMSSATASPPNPGREASPQKIDSISKKIIRNGRMEIQVGDLNKSRLKVEDHLKKLEAYVQDEDFRNSEYSENLNLTVRVPHRNFDTLVNSLSGGIGSVLSKSISSADVTEEYTDVSIRLANKKIYLEKYRELLKRAASTKDLLEIQEKIRGLEEEIDVAEGRLRYIDDKVNYSTLELFLTKEKVRDTLTSRIGFGSRLADSLAQGWNIFVGFLLGVVSLWPFFILIPVMIYIFRKWKRRKKIKKE